MPRSKLSEKGVRMPEVRQARFEKAVPAYLADVEALSGEDARAHRFTALLQKLLGEQNPDFIRRFTRGVEEWMSAGHGGGTLRGRADNLFGHLIIEFERALPDKREEAEEQIRRYAAIQWSNEDPEARAPYLGVATDGVRFVTYTPVLADTAPADVAPEDVTLEVVGETDWRALEPAEVFYWLDRTFLRQEILRPTSEGIVRDFGLRSHAYHTTGHALLHTWERVHDESAFAVVHDGWKKYLRIVYGEAVEADALFIRHTYLATLAKLMAFKRITGKRELPGADAIARILAGRYFRENAGIDNFIEEDFFSWIARPEVREESARAVRRLFSLLQKYNLRELSEDVLKALYQELVDPETRHDLGEYYTPDWLAHRIVRRALDQKPDGALFDPSCGSGTFLYLAIHEKRARRSHTPETLKHILHSIYGADVHPLAVIVAKTNYLLGLGDLIQQRDGPVTLPVYLADTIRLPERWAPTEDAEYTVRLGGMEDGRTAALPPDLLKSPGRFDRAIERARDFAQEHRGAPVDAEGFRRYLAAQRFEASDALAASLFTLMKDLKYFIDQDRDSIWAFVLKNIYKPLFFRKKFDFVVGNPPWISYRYMAPGYQAFLKQQITQEYRLLEGQGHLITQMEIATLFMARAADLYLKEEGAVAFVMPRSVFVADQHDGFRSRTFRLRADPTCRLFVEALWDLEGVTPLFKVPACVVRAEKRPLALGQPKATAPIGGETLSGQLDRKNAALDEAEDALAEVETTFRLYTRGDRSFWAETGGLMAELMGRSASRYADRFYQGATLVPRSLWFVDFQPSALGINTSRPAVHSSDYAVKYAKGNYKDLFARGTVERRFLYATLLSADLLPFAHLAYRPVVLPILPRKGGYRLLNAEEVRKRGATNLARWLDTAEAEWTERRGASAKGYTAPEWLNYRNKLTRQDPRAAYRVIYNKSGTHLAAAVVEAEDVAFQIDGQVVEIQSYVADHVTYVCETDNLDEAHYLAAVLNAPIINRLIKPMQARGLWGARDIHKKVLELPIPVYDADNEAHRRLSERGAACAEAVRAWIAGGGPGATKSIGRLRSTVRAEVVAADELAAIDVLVCEALGMETVPDLSDT